MLVLDEIQKIPGWSETVKRLWDEDTAARLPLHVVVLGSAPLLVQRGLSESLAGRFEVIRVPHWSLAEMREAFGWSLEQYIYYGGYPGSAPLIGEPQRWRRYILDSLVETTISRDILLMQRVDKPALLRRLFELGCQYSGQVLSYTKMLGQLQDAGNTTTLAHYLELAPGSGLAGGARSKYAGQTGPPARLQPQVPGAQQRPDDVAVGPVLRGGSAGRGVLGPAGGVGRGMWLVNCRPGHAGRPCTTGPHGDREVDFVLAKGEARSSPSKSRAPGAARPLAGHGSLRRPVQGPPKLLVGGQGIPLEEFLTTEAEEWF